MIKVSVIIPYYQAEEYIERCIRSVYDQDLPQSEFEVICVDDNPDNPTRDIVKRLQGEYPTLQLLILDKNVKQGGARNAGVKAANGDYIWFVDADDYVYPNVLKTFCKEMDENNLDFLHFNFNTELLGKVSPSVRGEYSNQVVKGVDLFFNPKAQWWTEHIVVWQRIHRRQFLLDNNLWFAEHVFCEDDDYSFMVYALAQRTKHIDVEGYCYRQNPESAMHQQCKPIYVVSLLKQAKRLSGSIDMLREVDLRFEEAVRSDMRSAFINKIEQFKNISSSQKKEIKTACSIFSIFGCWKVVPHKLLLFFFKSLYF